MKTKKIIVLLVLSFIFTFSSNAQTELTAAQQKEFKSKVQKSARATSSIVSDFTQTKHLFVLDNVITSEGKLVFKSPDKVRWEYVKPYLNVAIFKGNQLLVNNEGKRQNIDLGSNKMFKSLNSLIVDSIKGDMFDENQFEITYYTYDDQYLVKFIPKDKRIKKFIAAFELKFSQDNADVEEVKLIEPNDDYTTITFQNKKLNTAVADSLFEI